MPNTPKQLVTALTALFCALACSLAAPIAAEASPIGRQARARVHKHRAHGRRERSGDRRQRRQAAAAERQAKREEAARQRQIERRDLRGAEQESTAAKISGVLATPCANTELVPTAANLPVAEASALCLVNRERAEHGEPPLVSNADLQTAAEEHDSELIRVDYFAHVSPSGETPVDRIRDTGYIASSSDGYVLGENLAWGTYSLATPASIVAAWIASPGHLANILESQYTETGIAITPAVPESLAPGAPGATYAQEFGVLIH